MIISFDFDSTLTNNKIEALAKSLIKDHTVIILTSRLPSGIEEVRRTANTIGITTIHATSLKEKAEFILEQNLQIDIHFDDDFFEVDAINKKTTTMGILVDLFLHPHNSKTTPSGIIIPKGT